VGKLKLTRVELKRQKDDLARFARYLPTLMLKKQQLQIEIRRVEAALRWRSEAGRRMLERLRTWASVMASDGRMEGLLRLVEKRISAGNIAGVDIPVFEGVEFATEEYDLYDTPLWIDEALSSLEAYAGILVEQDVLRKQRDALAEELRITTQRVNLFEKVKIPHAQENIRIIRIFLGDQQTAAVVRGKISKAKLTEAVR